MIPPIVDGPRGAFLPPRADDPARVVSPELALVDDELRALAVALLPPVSPYAFLDHHPDLTPEQVVPLRPSLAVAGLAYLVAAILRTCVFNAVVFVGVALVVLLVNLAA